MSFESNKNIRIGEVLRDAGLITEDDINTALAYQREHRGMRLGHIMVELGLVSEADVLAALSRRLDVELVDVSTVAVDVDAVRLIPEEVARRNSMMAVSKREGLLTVLSSDPLNFFGLDEIRQVTGMPIEVKLASRQALGRAIDYYYREAKTFLLAEDASLAMGGGLDFVDLDVADGDDAPIAALLNQLVQYAYANGVSDIHIEPFQECSSIRMRLDGALSDYLTVKRSVHQPLIARVKIVSNMDIAERHMPQDGHFRTMVFGETVNIRVNVIPTVYGEKAVLRVLANARAVDRSTTFGMKQDDYEKFSKMLSMPNGIVFLTGPTGSGKTTTLYMALAALANDEVNISTIEDPVERNLPRINQMQVNEASGLTFSVGLRALMRQDPDVIMLGETRDEETATIAVRAAITGHLVLSTLHTNDAVSSIHRLTDMGVEPYMVSSSLAGVVAQRLLRKVCPDCAVSHQASEAELEILGLEPGTQLQIRSGCGCHTCNQTGYHGRTAVHEILLVDREVRTMINAGASEDEIRDYAIREQGMKTLRVAGVDAVVAGETTIAELMKVIASA